MLYKTAKSCAPTYFYRPQRSCACYVFTRVCDSVQGGGCYPSMHCRLYPSMPCSRFPGGGSLVSGGACSRGVCSRGVPARGGGLLLGGGSALGGACLGVCVWRPPESRRLLLRTVRILLECILVRSIFHLDCSKIKLEL